MTDSLSEVCLNGFKMTQQLTNYCLELAAVQVNDFVAVSLTDLICQRLSDVFSSCLPD